MERKGSPKEFTVIESGKKPGIASELFQQASDFLGEYYEEFGDIRGWVYMTTVDGIFMGIRFRPGVYNQDIRLHYPTGKVDLAFTRSFINNTTSVTGQFVPEVPIGVNITPLSRLQMTEYMEEAKSIIDTGLPITSGDALARLQDRSCSMIEGKEATEYQKIIEKMIHPQGDFVLGDRNADQEVLNFMPISQGNDEPWPVSSLTVVLSQGDAGTSIEDVKGRGRAILSTIGFSPNTFSSIDDESLRGEFLVSVQGVYDYEQSTLLASRVRFVSSILPIEVPPVDRKRIFASIAKQVTPEKMICIPQSL